MSVPEGAACISSFASVILSSANLLPAIAALALTSALTISKLASLDFAIAAEAFISAFTIAPSTIFADVIVLSLGVPIVIAVPRVRIKKSEPLGGAEEKIIELPSIANPSLG